MLYEIFYDPAATKKVPPNRKIRLELLENRNYGLNNHRPSTVGHQQRTDSTVECANDNINGIFLLKSVDLYIFNKILSVN